MFKRLDPFGKTVTIYIDGVPAEAEAAETVAAVILRQSEAWTRKSTRSGEKRAPFCMIGSCFECVAVIDGQSSHQTCLITVRDGMRVERMKGLRSVQ